MFKRFASKISTTKFNSVNKFVKRNNSTFSSSSSSSKTTALLGAVGLIGGGFLLLNTLNKPIVDTSGYTGSEGSTMMNEYERERKPNSIPKHVQEYLFNTYKYVASGLTITSLSAYFGYKSGLAMKLMQMNPILSGLGFLALSFGTMAWTRSVDPRNTVAKNIAFSSFNAVIGLSLCGLAFLHPQILLRAGIYTGGIVSALSFTAMNAKEDRFLSLGGPLMVGLTIVFLSGLTTMFLPARFVTTLSIMEKLWLYGGLAVFSGLMLYDTQKLMARANYRYQIQSQLPPPDYVNESIGIYLNIINIFVRMVMILSNSSNKRK
eukprot:gene2289-2462_t